jgi:hypothetical protein
MGRECGRAAGCRARAAAGQFAVGKPCPLHQNPDMRTAFRVVLGLVALVVLVVVGGGWVLSRTAWAKADEQRERVDADWKQFRVAIEADEARWKADPLLAPHDGPDAAPLLHHWVGFEKEPHGPPLPPAAMDALRGWGADWVKHTDELDVAGVDLAWMATLHTFGFWDLESEGPLKSRPLMVLTEPSVEVGSLLALAKARLGQGLKQGDPRAAAREVRELARLCFTTEQLIGSMIGIALLAVERRAHEEAVARHQDVDGWTPISEDEQRSLRRALWVAAAPTSFLAGPELAAVRLPVGECAGLREGLGSALMLHEFARDHEAARYATLGAALEASGCRLRRVRAAWANPSSVEALTSGGNVFCMSEPGQPTSDCSIPEATLLLPFVKSFLGATLSSIATPDWFKQYRPEAQPAK